MHPDHLLLPHARRLKSQPEPEPQFVNACLVGRAVAIDVRDGALGDGFIGRAHPDRWPHGHAHYVRVGGRFAVGERQSLPVGDRQPVTDVDADER